MDAEKFEIINIIFALILLKWSMEMCTAITYKTKDFYFGRNLDYYMSFGEEIVIVPRKYNIQFKNAMDNDNHYAIIGMAHVEKIIDKKIMKEKEYPLFYDAINEKGLAIAGLNFVGNAIYCSCKDNVDNIAYYELILWILCQCSSIKEVRDLIKRINITSDVFKDDLPIAQLHWIIADKNEAITLETTEEGIKIHDNPVGVLTNNPTFDKQMFNLNNYMHLATKDPKNTFLNELDLKVYSKGMGAIGLPGDVSSMSRFVRATFNKMNSISSELDRENIEQFFHILDSVSQIRGCCEVKDGEYEITIYSSCCNVDKGIYYYTTYNNRNIRYIDMMKEDLKGKDIIRYSI